MMYSYSINILQSLVLKDTFFFYFLVKQLILILIKDMQSEGQQAGNTLNYYQKTQPIIHQYTPAEQLKAAIFLSETMPPSKLRKNLIGLTTLAPQIEDIILEKVDQPLQIESSDPDHPFLKTQFNRDGDSYRSPHTNAYVPQAQGGFIPSGQLRKMQEIGNILFEEYTKLYYGNSALGSFYVAQGESPNQFSCGYFAKKELQAQLGFGGSWDSFNVVDVNIHGQQGTFNLSTTILIQMDIKNEKLGAVDMTGFMKQSKTQKRKLGKQLYDECLVIVGEMIEELQTVMRQVLGAVYTVRTKETIFSTRYENTVEYEKQKKQLAEGLKQIHLKG